VTDPALVFIGFMGAGKTSAARAVAAEMDTRPADSDQLIEERLGMSIEAFFETRGEHAFREAEEAAVLDLLDRPPSPVVSLGGGAVTSERVQAALARHTVVLLDVAPDTAWQRAGGRRPLARDRRRFDELLAQRSPLYERLADAILPASRRETVRAALPSVKALRHAPAGTKLIWAEAASGSHPVLIGEGIARMPVEGVVVTDANVGPLYAPDDAIVIPAGEEHKTLPVAEGVLRELARRGVDHDGRVIAIGGGVVGDLAGFCAAVYQRGIGVVQVPTTLVAQVDSAYGGKTGVDLPEGKNYAGAYHQPQAVHVDPSVLATLPAPELAAGWAEVIKTALIAGGPLWRRVREGEEAGRDLILACARTKLSVVAEDERDAGRRQALNLGHTLGHAIETVTGYRRYRHGEAVGLGLLAALTLSDRISLREEVKGLLAARGLPTQLPADIDREAVLQAAGRDKKRRGGRVGWVLVEAPGHVRTGCHVRDDDVRLALEELTRP
jgi:shikimate kinase/3-dehydroquinate synthase